MWGADKICSVRNVRQTPATRIRAKIQMVDCAKLHVGKWGHIVLAYQTTIEKHRTTPVCHCNAHHSRPVCEKIRIVIILRFFTKKYDFNSEKIITYQQWNDEFGYWRNYLSPHIFDCWTNTFICYEYIFPIACGINEDYSGCAPNACNTYSCDNPNGAAILCTDECRNPGDYCLCKPNYHRETPNGPCVPLECGLAGTWKNIPSSNFFQMFLIDFVLAQWSLCQWWNDFSSK